MKRTISYLSAAGFALLLLSLPLFQTGCGTAPVTPPGTNAPVVFTPPALNDKTWGTNGAAVLSLEGAAQIAISVPLAGVIDRSPQHAAQIRSDGAAIIAVLQGLQNGQGTITVAQIKTALQGAKLSTSEMALIVPAIVTALNTVAIPLANQGLSDTELAPYMPGIVATLVKGIQTGIA